MKLQDIYCTVYEEAGGSGGPAFQVHRTNPSLVQGLQYAKRTDPPFRQIGQLRIFHRRIGCSFSRAVDKNGLVASIEQRFEIGIRMTNDDPHRVIAGNMAYRQPGPVASQGASADEYRIAKRPHAVRVEEVLIISDPLGMSGWCGNFAIERLSKVGYGTSTAQFSGPIG